MVEREMLDAAASLRDANKDCADLNLRLDKAARLLEQAARRTTPDREAWQPIETAPKDGAAILGWNADYGARQTHWAFYGEGSIAKAEFDAGKGESGNWYWHEPQSHWLSSWNPTHWMPLPTAPTSDKGGA